MSVVPISQHQTSNKRWWDSIKLSGSSRDVRHSDVSEAPIQVYRRDIRDLASDIDNAKKLVAIKEQELLNAKDQLQRSCKAFVEFCGPDGMKLPISMEVLAPDAPENKPWEFKE